MSRAIDRLRRLLDPPATAVLTMEVQRGVVGPDGVFPALSEQAADADLVGSIARLCAGARDAGCRVVHNTLVSHPAFLGQSMNTKVMAVSERVRAERGAGPTELGTMGAELMEAIVEPGDLEVSRIHGMTPFMRTSLDQILRNLGITTVVATGVSVNIGLFGMVLGAADLGYDVVLPRDAVTGVPRDYADAVIDHSLAMLTTVTTVDDVLKVWAER